MTRTSCWVTAKTQAFEYLFEKKGDHFDYPPSICWTFYQTSLHDQSLLDYTCVMIDQSWIVIRVLWLRNHGLSCVCYYCTIMDCHTCVMIAQLWIVMRVLWLHNYGLSCVCYDCTIMDCHTCVMIAHTGTTTSRISSSQYTHVHNISGSWLSSLNIIRTADVKHATVRVQMCTCHVPLHVDNLFQIKEIIIRETRVFVRIGSRYIVYITWLG